MEQSISFSNQSKWEFIEYEICEKCESFSKVFAQKSHEQHADLLCKITKLEQDIEWRKIWWAWQNKEQTWN